MKVYILAQAVESGCKIDQDCGPQLTCMQQQCVNPCVVNDPCEGNLECTVKDTPSGKPLVACVCPEGMITGDNGSCKHGML